MSKSFLSKIGGIFYDDADSEVVVTSAKPSKTAVPTKRLDFSNTSSTTVPEQYKSKVISDQPEKSMAYGQFNEEFFNHFHSQIEANDIAGADYYEFRKTFEALKKNPNMSEIGALQATYDALRAIAPELTVPKLIETADFYLEVIDKENNDFIAELNDKLNVEVVGREATISNEEASQAEKLEVITKLQTEIGESAERVILLKNEVVAEETKLNEVKSNWDFTIQLVIKNIETDKANIQTHLK